MVDVNFYKKKGINFLIGKVEILIGANNFVIGKADFLIGRQTGGVYFSGRKT